MTKYSKASDSLVNVVDAKGKEHRVTQRAFDIVYKNQGFKLANESDKNTDFDEVDYFLLSRDELKGVKNDDMKDFLDKEDFEYDPKATKEDLINIILGE